LAWVWGAQAPGVSAPACGHLSPESLRKSPGNLLKKLAQLAQLANSEIQNWSVADEIFAGPAGRRRNRWPSWPTTKFFGAVAAEIPKFLGLSYGVC